MILTYDQGHWKLNEQVKLKEYHHHAKFGIYYIYGVWENHNVEIFSKPAGRPAAQNCSLHKLSIFMWVKN